MRFDKNLILAVCAAFISAVSCVKTSSRPASAYTSTISNTAPIVSTTFCPSQDNHCIQGIYDCRNFTIRRGYRLPLSGESFTTNAASGDECVDQYDTASKYTSVTVHTQLLIEYDLCIETRFERNPSFCLHGTILSIAKLPG